MDDILAIHNEPSDERSYEPRVRARARNRPTTRHGHGSGIAATRFDPIFVPVLSPDRLQLTPTIEQRPIPPKSLTKPALEPAKISAKLSVGNQLKSDLTLRCYCNTDRSSRE